jgi:NADP-dependent 3-hydroxy acid dehydrogenase YdfG
MKQGKQVILITGASAGMGKEFAKQILKEGHIVYGVARRLDKMNDLRQLGVRIMTMDVTDDASMVQAWRGTSVISRRSSASRRRSGC